MAIGQGGGGGGRGGVTSMISESQGAGLFCRDHGTLLRRNKNQQLRDNTTTTPARLAGIWADGATIFPAGPAW